MVENRPAMQYLFVHPVLPTQRRISPRRTFICSANKPPVNQRRTLLSRNISVLPVLVRTARLMWYQFWRLMMSELAPSDARGRYVRPHSPLNQPPFPLIAGATYEVYVGAACQWCHRVLIARALLGLTDQIQVRSLKPGEDGLWKLKEQPGLLRDVYLQRERKYTGRFTAPLLVEDGGEGRIVSNESADILGLLGDFAGRVRIDADTVVLLNPPKESDAGVDSDELGMLCQRIYTGINNGVYRCGFATSQQAYEEAEANLFSTLDEVEARLTKTRFLLSPHTITEADVRLFPTVFRFDAVYAVLFKACRKSIRLDYPAVSAWMRDIYNLRGVAETCDLEGTRNNYYNSLFPLNPGGIVPRTSEQDLSAVPDRRGLGTSAASAKA